MINTQQLYYDYLSRYCRIHTKSVVFCFVSVFQNDLDRAVHVRGNNMSLRFVLFF